MQSTAVLLFVLTLNIIVYRVGQKNYTPYCFSTNCATVCPDKDLCVIHVVSHKHILF